MNPGSDLGRFGREVARAQDEILERAEHIDRARGLFAEAPAVRRSPSRVVLGLAATGVAALALVLLFRPWSDPLTVRLADGRGVPVGAWIAAPGTRPLPLCFSDGSKVVLEPASSSRVVEADERGARIVLERGVARVSIAHRKGSRWTLAVGPYEVLVTGTRFRVAWDPQAESFTLSLERGTVRVTGPLLSEGRTLVAGQKLEASGRERRIEITDGTERSRPVASARIVMLPAPESPAVAPAPAPDEAEPMRERSARPAVRAATAGPSWRDLARRGSYREALEAAERAGFDAECARVGASDLHVLGDAARLAGSAPRAVQAFDALRDRFAGTPQAAAAAFALGRIAFDGRHAYAEAARWFETYLREAPRGPLAREASGRLIEARRRSGDAAGAREGARRYLEAYPSGPHADLARTLLAQ
ncbi:MAG: tetratricopeptide repeat protein [Deltaproteobacteria bacterium]|nr:tetratricopeptide repeat protein [Deltaproteobacteria bacterium]